MNHTFSSLGFGGINNIAKVSMDKDSKNFLPIEISRKDEPIYKKYLIPALMKYVRDAGDGIGFVAAVAYFMDGHVEYAYNNSNSRQYVVTGGTYDAEYYKSDKCPNGLTSNAQLVAGELTAKKPEGLMLFQEIPGDERSYRFRVVHDFPTDSVEEIKQFPQSLNALEVKRMSLIESAFEYLNVAFHGRENYSENEIVQIMTIMDMVAALDPDGRYVDREDDRVLGMGSFPLGRKSPERNGKIVTFPGNK